MKAHKEKLRVVIFTSNHRIKGEVHLYENSRLTDILNADTTTKDFLPVTDAELSDFRNGATQRVGFLSINRKHIEIVMEDDEAIAITKCKDAIAKRRYPEALGFARRAVAASPTDAEAHYMLGFCFAKTGDVKAAKASLDECLKMRPNADITQKAQETLSAITGV
ncbi:MAG: tetratricopeptide repeat protein [Candidatus Riflebacteria bacterium]|nr:tetratricopeptide repeat protein [Candidatus Riflebacteria bacterium]